MKIVKHKCEVVLVIIRINLVLGGGQVLSGPGTGPGPRQYGEELMSLLLPASVYKRPQTAAAPTLSSPCLMHRSEKTERKKKEKK